MRLNVSLRFSSETVVRVGTLSDWGRDTAFEYATTFIGRGLSPAPFRLPVRAGVSAYDRQGGMETFGLFEDSLPDGWGRRLVDARFRKRVGRLPTALERLACVGSGGRGALVYEPEDEEPDVRRTCCRRCAAWPAVRVVRAPRRSSASIRRRGRSARNANSCRTASSIGW